MSRAEFSKETKRAADERSGGFCEASGAMYGLPADRRCNMPLFSVQYDHIILDANSHDNSLANCAAVCLPCHRWKTDNHDTPMAAKTLRQKDAARNSGTAPKRPFPKRVDPWGRRKSNVRQLNEETP